MDELGNMIKYIVIIIIIGFAFHLVYQSNKLIECNKRSTDKKIYNIILDDKIIGKCTSFTVDSNKCIHFYNIETQIDEVRCGGFEIK